MTSTFGLRLTDTEEYRCTLIIYVWNIGKHRCHIVGYASVVLNNKIDKTWGVLPGYYTHVDIHVGIITKPPQKICAFTVACRKI